MSKLIGTYFDHFTVEIVVFLSFMALSSIYVSEHSILYDTVCHQTLNHTDADEGCDLANHPGTRRRVQSTSALWTVILSLSYSLPAIIGENVLGALGDQHGRKDCLLLALATLIATTVPDSILTYYVQAPLYSLVASTAVSGIAGSGSLIMSISLACIADGVMDKARMTYRMTVVFICRSLGAVAGAFLLGSLRPYVSFATNILLAQGVLVLAFMYTLIKMPRRHTHANRSPLSYAKKLNLESDQSMLNRETKKGNMWLEKLNGVLMYVFQSNRAILRTLLRRRRGQRRRYLITITCIYFIYMASEFSLLNGPLFSFYVFDRPFLWGPSDLSKFRGIQNIAALFGNIFGFLLVWKFPAFTDTTLILLSLVSGLVYLILVAFAKSTWVGLLYVAASLGAVNSLMIPATKSFVTQQVSKDEIGKALALNGVAAELGFVTTRIGFTTIYAITADNSAVNGAFVTGAGIIAASLIPSIWIHIQWERRKRRIYDLMTKVIVRPGQVISVIDGGAKCFL